MTIKTVHARFKGKHLSMGYRRGCVYKLYTQKFGPWDKFKTGWRIDLIVSRGTFCSSDNCDIHSPCPYSSLAAFLKNWEILPEDSKYSIKI